MYKFLFFLLMVVSAFLFFSWVIDNRYFLVYEEKLVPIEKLEAPKKVLILWSDDISQDGVLSEKNKEKLDVALSVYTNKYCEKIILSGDKDHEFGNIVLEMMDYLVSQDIPVEDLIADFYSPSLYSSIFRMKEVYALSDFFLLAEDEELLKFLYISAKLDLEPTAVSYEKGENTWFKKVLAEWKILLISKIFSPEVYIKDKDPNYLLEDKIF